MAKWPVLLYVYHYTFKKEQHARVHEPPHLSPAFLLVVGPWAWLVIQQRADQGRGLLGVGAQVGRQDHVGGYRSSLRVDGQL